MYNNNEKRKHYVSAQRRKSLRRHQLLAVTSILALCSFISGITLAFIFTVTAPLTNTFTPAQVSCEVLETFDGVTKSDVKIKNTGKTDSYIRAAVVVTWASSDGTRVTAAKPAAGTDYSITFADASAWKLSSDGFWYYTLPVAVDAETDTLIESCTRTTAPPDGFYLSVEIVASSIQSSPTDVVKRNWSSGVKDVSDTALIIKEAVQG